MGIFSKEILTAEEKEKIAAAIAGVERTTVGEIRVSVVRARSVRNRSMSLYDLAVKNFYELGMEKTKEKTGVLIYLLVNEKKFQIIGDEGINKKVSKEFWDVLAFRVSEYFRQQKFADGILFAIGEVGAVLTKEFPMKAGDTNELSNDVVVS